MWFPQVPILLIGWELISIRGFSPTRLFPALFATVLAAFRSWAALQLEILALRHQLGVLQRSAKRPKLTALDRMSKDSPEPRPVPLPEMGRIVAVPQVGRLHHRYEHRAA